MPIEIGKMDQVSETQLIESQRALLAMPCADAAVALRPPLERRRHPGHVYVTSRRYQRCSRAPPHLHRPLPITSLGAKLENFDIDQV